MEIRYYGDKISERIAKTPEGFLICQDVPISRTGYQEYLASELMENPTNKHKIIPVYRPAKEVFDIRSLASFEGKPVTNEHPDEDVTPENYTRYSCGHVQNVHVGDGEDSNKVLADLYITDPNLIHLIENGKREISCGYYAEERRDDSGHFYQTKIRGNHVAVVKSGRAGNKVCIRDSKRNVMKRKSSLNSRYENAFSAHKANASRAARSLGDSRYFDNLYGVPFKNLYKFGGNGMRKKHRNLLFDEDILDNEILEDDDLLEEDVVVDDDELLDEETFIGDDDVSEEDVIVDDDYLEDEDESFVDEDYLEDEDVLEDEDTILEDEEFEDEDKIFDDDELIDSCRYEDFGDEFEDDDVIVEDEDEIFDEDYLEDEDFEDDEFKEEDEVSSDGDDFAVKAESVLRDAKKLLKDARYQLKRLKMKDAIILNDDDLEDDDYLEDEDLLEDEEEFEDDDLAIEDEDLLEDDEDFEEKEEVSVEDEDEPTEDEDPLADSCHGDSDESEVIDTDKTKALREIAEASRGVSDPNERKQLQDAIYKSLCGKNQMADVMRITKKNRSRMDSAPSKNNKVDLNQQQSIYDSFNPHKKTSF